MKTVAGKLIRLYLGIFVCAIGMVLTINAKLGLAPWDVLHQGLARLFHITIGQANISIAIICVIADIFLGENLGWGTVINMVFLGVFIDMVMLNHLIPISHNILQGVAMMISGMLLIGVACFLYIGSGMGVGPRDGIMMAFHKKTKKPIKLIRGIMEISVLIIGYFLGGNVGIGTIVAALGLGYCMQFVFKLFKFDAAKVNQRYIIDDIKLIKNRMVKS